MPQTLCSACLMVTRGILLERQFNTCRRQHLRREEQQERFDKFDIYRILLFPSNSCHSSKTQPATMFHVSESLEEAVNSIRKRTTFMNSTPGHLTLNIRRRLAVVPITRNPLNSHPICMATEQEAAAVLQWDFFISNISDQFVDGDLIVVHQIPLPPPFISQCQ